MGRVGIPVPANSGRFWLQRNSRMTAKRASIGWLLQFSERRRQGIETFRHRMRSFSAKSEMRNELTGRQRGTAITEPEQLTQDNSQQLFEGFAFIAWLARWLSFKSCVRMLPE
jgi:hypothetical protein